MSPFFLYVVSVRCLANTSLPIQHHLFGGKNLILDIYLSRKIKHISSNLDVFKVFCSCFRSLVCPRDQMIADLLPSWKSRIRRKKKLEKEAVVLRLVWTSIETQDTSRDFKDQRDCICLLQTSGRKEKIQTMVQKSELVFKFVHFVR